MKFYDGAREKVCRLGLADLLLELQDIILSVEVYLQEVKDANGAAVLRKMIDGQFEVRGAWEKIASGGIDWTKKLRYNQTILVRLGVELQVSARSDMLIRDIVHLRNSIDKGEIDVGVVIVPDDRLQVFLPDRTPAFRDAVKYVEEEFREAMNYPLIVIAIEHDGPGEALGKQTRRA
ncbi:MAG: hypothetical protein QM570_10015 [Planctomycetota bacterium]|nr:hypothetical protein [Planctomycetota bacterium]